jgi:hypothetical protein
VTRLQSTSRSVHLTDPGARSHCGLPNKSRKVTQIKYPCGQFVAVNSAGDCICQNFDECSFRHERFTQSQCHKQEASLRLREFAFVQCALRPKSPPPTGHSSHARRLFLRTGRALRWWTGSAWPRRSTVTFLRSKHVRYRIGIFLKSFKMGSHMLNVRANRGL